MPVLEATLNPAYYMGILIFLVVVAMAVIRQKETKAITRRFSREETRLVAFAVTFFGVESENKKPLKVQGALILTDGLLAFQSRFGDRGFDLPVKSISGIGTTDSFCSKNLHQTVVSVEFRNEGNGIERAAYRIPHPAKWVKALRSTVSTV
jgi:hypothetical protein